MTDLRDDALLNRNTVWRERVARYRSRLPAKPPALVVEGTLTRMVGLTMEAAGCEVQMGGRCRVIAGSGHQSDAEVVGFGDGKVYLMPTGALHGIGPSARVIPAPHEYRAPAGDTLLGRVLDGAGEPLDGLGPLNPTSFVPLSGTPINPLARQPVREPLDVGVRSINALMTVGRGQRIGLFAGSGVGKSRLLGMMTRFTEADVIVVGLIGERGREVREFVDDILGEGRERAVVIATPADHPPLMRLHGAMLATSIAEHFRDQGRRVLLLMDSLTRFAQAQREIALAVGEPPATKGYPPSVFARLPQLVERAGNSASATGSLTAFYTVLAEGDDPNDPIVDAARAILDGHIVLSRRMADSGLYPAIDIEASISRCMNEIVSPPALAAARLLRSIYATYQRNEDLISVGAYARGSDPQIDMAIRYWPTIRQFLAQDLDQCVPTAQASEQLLQLVAPLASAGNNATANAAPPEKPESTE